ncbi:MAG: glycosyltransferase [Thermoplasmata archaeon]|nr:glycosyltransferase [Thermoplasmata archaeon]MCI4341186.1 glycosyltransferase [Thermoplasmata archaeon]
MAGSAALPITLDSAEDPTFEELDGDSPTTLAPVQWLTGGIVAHNEERRLAASVRSLLSQQLPIGFRWGTVWVVVSGSTDGTEQVARSLALEDRRVRLVIESRRRGKSAALALVLARATGHLLVLLNADAVAEPGSLLSLLDRARRLRAPFAVMGRPLPPAPDGGFSDAVTLLWDLHHRLHVAALQGGVGTHLSDELLLLSLTRAPPLAEGIVNDGAFVGAWLSSHAGTLDYSPAAGVGIAVPSRWHEHLRQRRRIHFGHRQVSRLVGVAPTTWLGFLRQRPRAAWALLRAAVRARPDGVRSFAYLATAELAALCLAGFDQLSSREQVLWTRVTEYREPTRTSTAAART